MGIKKDQENDREKEKDQENAPEPGFEWAERLLAFLTPEKIAEENAKMRALFAPDLEAPALKPSNPKDIVGSDKLPLHLWPETATAMGCLGLLDGALKYGRANFRAVGVRASIYVDAAERHLKAWFEGEDTDPDSGLPHFAHALACIAILVDAQAAGKLNDDRQFPGGYRAIVTQLTPHVARLKALHAGKSPKHYTIVDGGGSEGHR